MDSKKEHDFWENEKSALEVTQRINVAMAK